MKTTFVKITAVTVLLFFSFNILKAEASFSTADTVKKTLLASNQINKQVVIKEANVVFPEIFKGHEEEVMDYVEKFSINRRSYLMKTFSRSNNYFPKAKSILSKYDVPEEYVILMALESNFNGNARSSAGAVGYWQFMDAVAKEYGLRIAQKTTTKKVVTKKGKKVVVAKKSSTADDRKNFLKSTDAAARYIQDRMRNLNNDWLLVAASYNWGIGNVWNAMKRTGKEKPSFWDIKQYLPAETRSYVMNFITLNVIANNYENFEKNELLFNPILAEVAITPATLAMPDVIMMN